MYFFVMPLPYSIIHLVDVKIQEGLYMVEYFCLWSVINALEGFVMAMNKLLVATISDEEKYGTLYSNEKM